MRRFSLKRTEDETGISGVGYIAEGVQFHNSKCALCWRTDPSSIGIYDSIETLIALHGHSGKTVVVWLDYDETEEA